MLVPVVIYACLGAVAGILAGLLGVGGGIVIVPMLSVTFAMQNLPHELIMHLALGTSMASIIFTSFSSAMAHNGRQSVLWNLVKIITPSIILGTFFGSFIASKFRRGICNFFCIVFIGCGFSNVFRKKSESEQAAA